MPPLLQSAQLKPDVTITSADSDAEIDEDDDRFLFLLVSGFRVITIEMRDSLTYPIFFNIILLPVMWIFLLVCDFLLPAL